MQKASKQRNAKKGQQKKKKEFDLFTEIIGLCIVGIAILICVSLFTTQVGLVGDGIRSLLLGLFGVGGYMMPFIVALIGIHYIKGSFSGIMKTFYYTLPVCIILMVFMHVMTVDTHAGESLWSLYYLQNGSWHNGGWLGALLGTGILSLFGIYGTYVVLFISFGIWLLLVTKFPIFSWTQRHLKALLGSLKKQLSTRFAHAQAQRKLKQASKKAQPKKTVQPAKQAKKERQDEEEHPPIIINQQDVCFEYLHTEEVIDDVPECLELASPQPEIQEKPPVVPVTQAELEATWQEIENEAQEEWIYRFPSIELLHKKEVQSNRKGSSRNFLESAKKLEDTLLSFGVVAKVTQINQGPTVTRYELQPKQGVKVSKIVNLADDIALNLAASGIRIEAPIPGKAAVGIEVPNEQSEMVYLREVIETDQFVAFPSKLAFALGRDIGGKPIIADIGKMPHMLIAGATGSGKSVCINTLITSILYKASPAEVKLIMIDPKVVELNVYNGIPHLLIPVVTDPKKAAGALSWAVNEMTKRYQMFADNNVRDMKGFNAKVTDETQRMPNIIIIIDELADLMMTAAKEVEDAICRLAQMARAAGIHLVIATQRPSVDVITGVIKANIPSRLAFAVSSGIDSRTILDANGAEKLLGKGDMLFYPVGEAKPIRIQGAFISDTEVESIVDAVKQSGEVKYEESIIESITTSAVPIESSDEDELIVEAIQLANGKDKLSISMLQRYFRIGFNRASRLMDALEARGIVGPDEGSKPRKVLQKITLKEDM